MALLGSTAVHEARHCSVHPLLLEASKTARFLILNILDCVLLVASLNFKTVAVRTVPK